MSTHLGEERRDDLDPAEKDGIVQRGEALVVVGLVEIEVRRHRAPGLGGLIIAVLHRGHGGGDLGLKTWGSGTRSGFKHYSACNNQRRAGTRRVQGGVTLSNA